MNIGRHFPTLFKEESKFESKTKHRYYHIPMYMGDYVNQLDAVLTSGNRKLLKGSGTVSHTQALKKAKTEYRKYQEKTIAPVEEAYIDTIKSLEKEAKKKSRE